MTSAHDESPLAALESDASQRREQQVELAVFLFLIVPSLLLSFMHGGQAGRLSFSLLAVSVIARDLALVALVVFFLWRNQEPLKRIGWSFHRNGREIGLGVLLFLPLQAGAALLELTLHRFGFSVPAHLPTGLKPAGIPQVVLALVLVLVVAVAEETIFRGYILLRLKSWTNNVVVIIAVSSLVFAIGHGYEGTAGVITVGATGAVLALVYLWRKSLVAPITLHFLVDLAGIVVLPIFGRS